MANTLEEHLADFLIDQEKLGLRDYCRKALEHWREHYGEDVAAKVEAILKAHYRGRKREQR